MSTAAYASSQSKNEIPTPARKRQSESRRSSTVQSAASRSVALAVPIQRASVQRACGCGSGSALSEEEMMERAVVQPSLTVSTPGDPYEVEADRVADEVMRMPDQAIATPQLQRLADDTGVQRQSEACAAQSAGGDLGAMVVRGTSGGGSKLDGATRVFMESRFGQDFGHVRVHTGGAAADSARSINALAYTVGSDIVFGDGQYAPQTSAGRRLLAHELTHTVRQGGGIGRAPVTTNPASRVSIQRWPLTVMRAGCADKSYKNCGGLCTHPTSGKPGACVWSGTVKYGCVCREFPTRFVPVPVTVPVPDTEPAFEPGAGRGSYDPEGPERYAKWNKEHPGDSGLGLAGVLAALAAAVVIVVALPEEAVGAVVVGGVKLGELVFE